jgi:hypothetical protein
VLVEFCIFAFASVDRFRHEVGASATNSPTPHPPKGTTKYSSPASWRNESGRSGSYTGSRSPTRYGANCSACSPHPTPALRHATVLARQGGPRS